MTLRQHGECEDVPVPVLDFAEASLGSTWVSSNLFLLSVPALLRQTLGTDFLCVAIAPMKEIYGLLMTWIHQVVSLEDSSVGERQSLFLCESAKRSSLGATFF